MTQIQAFMYKLESEPERESEEAETMEETRLQQDVSEWQILFFFLLTFHTRVLHVRPEF